MDFARIVLTVDSGEGYAVGHLVSVVTTGVSSTIYTGFDALGRATQSTQTTLGNTYTFLYSYNLLGALTMEVYPSGRILQMGYDPLNRITEVGGSAKTYVSGIAYAPHGGFQSFAYGNGFQRFEAYNQRLQPAEMVDVPSSGGCGGSSIGPTGKTNWALDLQLFWGQNATQATKNNGSLDSQLIQTCNGTGYATANNYYQGYAYDGANRLTSVTDNGGGTNERDFAYDVYGNMWVSGQTGAFPSLSASTPTSNIYSYDQRTDTNYDKAGNETNIVGVCPAAGCLSYDGENHVVDYSGSGATYGYDGNGNRVYKLIKGVYTIYVYDVNGNLAATYNSGSIATPPCTTCFLSVDHLGSTRMVTDQSGNLVARHDYLPFGDEITNGYAGRPSGGTWGGSDTVVQKFTGKERDSESGLDYFGARYYGSALGRFTSADPVFVTAHRVNDPQEWNLYAYSRNNPLRFTDPTGLDVWLQGCGDESDTCHKGYVGSYNDKGKFERTHLSGDLTDSASLGTTGISVNYNGGTYQGVWDTNKNEQNAATVGGSGALSDLSFTVNGNCNGTCQASGFVNGTNTSSGLQALQFAVTSPGSGFLKNPGFYGADPFHAGRTNFLGYDPNQPQGLAATHLPVPGSVLIDPTTGQPINVDFHVDQRYPFEDVTGFANHVGSIGHTLLNDARSIFTGLVDQGNH